MTSALICARLALLAAASPATHAADPVTLLNVSYDPTRELYEAYNKLFAAHWQQTAGQEVTDPAVPRRLRAAGALGDRRAAGRRGHAGARLRHRRHRREGEAAADRLAAEAAEQQLALHLHHRAAGEEGQSEEHPRLGRPRAARACRSSRPTRRPPAARAGTTWRPGPTRSEKNKGNEAAATEFLRRLFANVPVLDTGARGSTMTFVQRGIGDVLLAWENEAFLARDQLGKDRFEIVVPSVSILAEPPVAVVERNAQKHGTAAGRARLPGVPVLARGAGTDRQELLPPQPAVRGRQVRQPVPETSAGDHQGPRRLEGRAGKALRRRRHLRPDHAQIKKAPDEPGLFITDFALGAKQARPQAAWSFDAAGLPRSVTTSKETVCPSVRVARPAA